MGYYDETKKKYISKYNKLSQLRASIYDYSEETEREKEIKRIVDRMEDIPSEYLLEDDWTVQKAKRRARKARNSAPKKT